MKRVILLGAILLAVMLAILPACSPSTAGKVLKVGIMTPSTGPAAEKGSPMGHANLDAFEYINTELGGIEGYKVEVIWLDSAYDSAKVATIINRFMDEGALIWGTASSKEGTATPKPEKYLKIFFKSRAKKSNARG